jgi:multicomponent Na+:H+ antiporter subunit E
VVLPDRVDARGLDVAWRALHPALPIEPQFQRFRLHLPEGQPRTLMVSVLSLMPGTLSAELEDDATRRWWCTR